MIKRLFVTTAKHSKLHQSYKVLLDSDERKELAGILNMKTHLENFISRESQIGYRTKFRLIEGDEYYITNNESDIKEANLIELFDTVINVDSEFDEADALTFKKDIVEFDEREKERFFIIAVEYKEVKYLLFSYINSRDIVRHKKFLDRNFSLNKNSAIIDVTNGLPVPESVTATYSFDTDKLYIHDPFKFERMFYLHEANKEKAREQINSFNEGESTVGHETYKVSGLARQDVKDIIFSKVRYIRRLADYNPDTSHHPIEKIEEAVNKLSNDIEKVKFCHTSKTITVNYDNVKTFVAIIHDSIVQRIISGEVEVI